MITFRNVEKFCEGVYGRTYVLRRINLEIREGEFMTVMAPSGAGKSTLLSTLGMLDGAWTGEFEFLGRAATRRPGLRHPGLVSHRRQARPLPEPALGRAAATGGGGPGGDRQPQTDPGG